MYTQLLTHAAWQRMTVFRSVQGIIGETYNRMLVGDAVKDPNSQYYLPDDYTFRGKGAEETYIVEGYFGETADTMFAKVSTPLPAVLCLDLGGRLGGGSVNSSGQCCGAEVA